MIRMAILSNYLWNELIMNRAREFVSYGQLRIILFIWQYINRNTAFYVRNIYFPILCFYPFYVRFKKYIVNVNISLVAYCIPFNNTASSAIFTLSILICPV